MTWMIKKIWHTDDITGYIDPDSDGGLEDDLNSRRYRAMLPEDDYDSEDDYQIALP